MSERSIHARPLVVIGAGGHGKVVADILLAAGEEVTGFLDDVKEPGTQIMGLAVLGSSTEWLSSHLGARVALGIGHNLARERAAAACVDAGAELVAAIHPTAVVSRSARIEQGVVVMALAVINADASIGRGAIINTACVIEHDCVIGPFAHVSPNAALAGACRLGARAHLGISAAMLPGTSIGDDTVVGGGAVVVKGLPAGAVAFGVPARVRT
jgi:sugar O-acyltransferase (sialic acid O-acetyltransferase NeuD family)